MTLRACRYCGGPIRKRKFETHENFAARDYCNQPACLAKGGQAKLEPAYSKERDEAAHRHMLAFITRELFIQRWGMEPMEAMDRYGHQASEDWERVYAAVKEGQTFNVTIHIEVKDTEGGDSVFMVDTPFMIHEHSTAREVSQALGDNIMSALEVLGKNE